MYDFLYRVGGVPWERAGEGELDRLLHREEERPGGSGSLLDLGCGTGMYALAAAARGWHVVGIDASQVAIDRARDRAATSDVDVRFEVGDVARLTDLGIPPGSIDLFIRDKLRAEAPRKSTGEGPQ